MKLLFRPVIVMVACLVAILLLAVPAGVRAAAPFVTLSPHEGVPGGMVTIHGYHFGKHETVVIYYYLNAVQTTVATDVTNAEGYFQQTFTIPESPSGLQVVRVDVRDIPQALEWFTVKPGLTVSHGQGFVGTTVTVQGRGFAHNESGIDLRYYFNGDYKTVATNIRADAYGSWETSFQIPASSRGEYRIDARGDVSGLPEVDGAIFVVKPGISIDKPSGTAGNTREISGSGFLASEGDIQVLFAGQTVAMDINADAAGNWQADFVVSEMPAGTYSVTADGKRTTKEDIAALDFAIRPDLILSPAEGHAGMELTASGRGFAPTEHVVVTYEDKQVATAITDDKGRFAASFSVPESRHGQRLVSAEDAVGNKLDQPAVFIMESAPPPRPELISPRSTVRIGFVGWITPTFQWSEVVDVSGVYYSLQIAPRRDFTHPVVSVTGLVETSYALPETEALPYGTYYWRVRAVDGAENIGQWSGTYAFQSGLLPLWVFIGIVALVIVLVSLLCYHSRKKKTFYQ